MKVYVIVEYFQYEGYDKPEYVFNSLEKAEAKRLEMEADWSDRDLRIVEMEVA